MKVVFQLINNCLLSEVALFSCIQNQIVDKSIRKFRISDYNEWENLKDKGKWYFAEQVTKNT